MLIKKSGNFKLPDFLITYSVSRPRLTQRTAPKWFE